MAPRETENFGVTNKEHYGMLWYFSAVANNHNMQIFEVRSLY